MTTLRASPPCGLAAPLILGVINTQTGGLSLGLLIVAAVVVCATLQLLAFVPRFVPRPTKAAR